MISENVNWEALKSQLEEDVLACHSLLTTAGTLPPPVVRIVTTSVLRKWFLDGWINKLGASLGVAFSFPSLDTSVLLKR